MNRAFKIFFSLISTFLITPSLFATELEAQSIDISIGGYDYSKVFKKNLEDSNSIEAIRNDLKELSSKDHVVQFTQGEYLYTLLPVKDSLFDQRRLDIYSAHVKAGKLAVKKWLIQAAKNRNLLNSIPQEQFLSDFIDTLQDQSDKDIQKFLAKNKLSKMPTKIEILEKAKSIESGIEAAKNKNKAKEELSALVDEINSYDQSFTLPNGEKFDWKERLTPDAYIYHVGFKLPYISSSGHQSLSNNTPFIRNLGGQAKWAIETLISLLSGTSNTLTFIQRPWIQHVRNLNTNEIIMSTDDPETWYWEKSGQLWINKNKPPEIAPKPKKSLLEKSSPLSIRVGVGGIWAKDMHLLSEIKGVFLGAATTVTRADELQYKKPVSFNLKAGVILPTDIFNLLDITRTADYFYIMGSIQYGVPINKPWSKHFNAGYIFKLSDILGLPSNSIVPPQPIQTVPGKIPSNNPGAPGLLPGSGISLNPSQNPGTPFSRGEFNINSTEE